VGFRQALRSITSDEKRASYVARLLDLIFGAIPPTGGPAKDPKFHLRNASAAYEKGDIALAILEYRKTILVDWTIKQAYHMLAKGIVEMDALRFRRIGQREQGVVQRLEVAVTIAQLLEDVAQKLDPLYEASI